MQNNEDIQAVSDFIEIIPDLPLHLDNGTICFDQYIVGSLTVGDILINIHPRIEGMTINNYFEMQLYTEGIIEDDVNAPVNKTNDFGLQGNVVDMFLQELNLLLINKDLDGHFISVQDRSDNIRGRILVDKIEPLDFIYETLPIEYPYFTVNISANQYIKLALDKVRVLLKQADQRRLFLSASNYFSNIKAFSCEQENYEKDITINDYWNIPKYERVLFLAEIIMNNIKMNLSNSMVYSTAYLLNSNTIFESYVRKVMDRNIDRKITKWDKPKTFAEIDTKSGTSVNKSYIPDILVDYDTKTNTAYIVMDAKNKDIKNNASLISVSDLYQLIFYSSALDTQYCGLIYPSASHSSSGIISIDSYSNSTFFYFTINFSLPIKERHNKFISELRSRFK